MTSGIKSVTIWSKVREQSLADNLHSLSKSRTILVYHPSITLMSLSSLEVQALNDINKVKAEYALLASQTYSLRLVGVVAGVALIVGLILGHVL